MHHNPKVSIITVNYNNLKVTLEFLDSIKLVDYDNYEVIVVDNNSKENPKLQIENNYPDVKVINSDLNLGFAGGNNLGIQYAAGDFVFLVNNDTELTPNIIQPLIKVFDLFPDVGAVSPKFRYYFNKNIIEYAGYHQVSKLTGRNQMVGCGEEDKGQYNLLSKTNYVHGGGMMLSKDVINDIGLMPEVYFLYYEEFDWCEVLKKKGYDIYYQPKALIYHKESMTTGKNSRLKTYYLNRSRILFMRRNRSLLHLVLFYSFLIFISIPKNITHYLITKDFSHLVVYFKAIFWNIKESSFFEYK